MKLKWAAILLGIGKNPELTVARRKTRATIKDVFTSKSRKRREGSE